MTRPSKTIGRTTRGRQGRTLKSKPGKARKSAPRARSAADAKNLARDLNDALAREAATADVLKAISRSTFDLPSVLDILIKSAARLCKADRGSIMIPRGTTFHQAASFGQSPEFRSYLERHPIALDRASIAGRVTLEREIVHVEDMLKDSDASMVQRGTHGEIRTGLGIPLLREGRSIGVILLTRTRRLLFSDKQIELGKIFADQAVIAIENARLLNELRLRTHDLAESLEQQTATSEVLKVISSSPGELAPVFESLLASAKHLCGADFGIILLREGDAFRTVALHGATAEYTEVRWQAPFIRPAADTGLGRVLETKQVVQIADVRAVPGYVDNPMQAPIVQLAGVRSKLCVPMLKEDDLIGVIEIDRQEVRPFTEKQIELMQNFAAQAVIAIENARLLNELRLRTDDLAESLEQQTATSEVLKVISGSPGELRPVFQAMLENATRLCDARFGVVLQFDGEWFEWTADVGTPPAFTEFLKRQGRFKPEPGGLLDRVMQTGQVSHTVDYAAEGIPSPPVKFGGARSSVDVPMLKDGQLVGAFSIYRQEVRPFTEKQIALLTNFAAQAAIAIENAQLLNELRQSLEQQTATSDVLRIISSSPGELQPVFDTMLAKTTELCEASYGALWLCEGDSFRTAAFYGELATAYLEQWHVGKVFHFGPEVPSVRAVRSGKPIQEADLKASNAYRARERLAVTAVDLAGIRTLLAVPMLKENEPIGVIAIYRKEVRPFTDKQIDLVANFAAQAVIAIENARLLNDLNNLNQQLEQRVTDQVSEIERMGRLRRFLPPQVADLIVASGDESQLESHRREITALFCDLRGFTGFSERSDPEDLMLLLREYHAAIGKVVVAYNGTVGHYAGDGVMVFFNDPIPIPNPALQAVLAALDMRAAIVTLTEKWRRLGHELGFGVGIAHGFATLGTIGFDGRFDYAAIGTVCNVASRLCDEAKSGQVLISPRVLMAVESAVNVEHVGDFSLKGISRPVAAYNLLSAIS